MKPPKFHVGQAVVCCEDDWEELTLCGQKVGEVPGARPIYHVRATHPHLEYWYVLLSEIPGYYYDEDGFAPVEEHPAEVIEALLEESFTVTA